MVFSLFWVFCISLPNQVEHTQLKSQLHICNYKWARILLVDGGLDSKLQHYGPCKISWKKSETLHLDYNGHIEGDIMQNCEQKNKIEKKWKNQDFMVKTNFFLAPCPSALGQFSHMAACRSSSKNIGKMSLIPVFNKTSPRAYTELDLDMLGVHGKLVKYAVHSSKRKNWKEFIFVHTSCPNNNRPIFGFKEF
jgi:hypothetical protein